MKVLISDPMERSCIDILEAEGFVVEYSPGLPDDELRQRLHNCDALIVRSGTRVTADLIAVSQKLKVIGRAGVGVDNVDVKAATRRGIVVMNAPGGNTISTAEHTLSLLLALARNIPQADASLHRGEWERKKYVGIELFGKTIGIIGLGKVGREVAKRCVAFDMVVLAYDPVLTPEVASKMGVELAELPELLRRSDFITIHTPLSEETRHLLDADALRTCKPGVRLVNCARGGIIDEAALLDALQEGRVAGVALDVFEHEPPGDHPLLHHPRVVATPHLGASTEEAQEKVARQIAQQVADALKGRGITGSVNADAIQMAMRTELHPWLELAEKLGSLTAQLMQGRLRSVKVTMAGDVLHQASSVITAAVLKGLTASLLSEPVNYVNAPVIAQERGIQVNEMKELDHEVYTHLVKVTYETDKEVRELAGTVFGHRTIRIVGIDTFHFEIKPEGHLLFYTNLDKPGMLAAVGKILADAQINIAGVSLGRYGVGTQALTVMNIDSPIDSETLKRISRIEGVGDVRVVRM